MISEVSKKPSDGKVIIEDLLGGFSEVVKSDAVENGEKKTQMLLQQAFSSWTLTIARMKH